MKLVNSVALCAILVSFSFAHAKVANNAKVNKPNNINLAEELLEEQVSEEVNIAVLYEKTETGEAKAVCYQDVSNQPGLVPRFLEVSSETVNKESMDLEPCNDAEFPFLVQFAATGVLEGEVRYAALPAIPAVLWTACKVSSAFGAAFGAMNTYADTVQEDNYLGELNTVFGLGVGVGYGWGKIIGGGVALSGGVAMACATATHYITYGITKKLFN